VNRKTITVYGCSECTASIRQGAPGWKDWFCRTHPSAEVFSLIGAITSAASAAALLGAKGGAAGRGKTKRRTTSFDAATAAQAGSATGPAKRRDPERYREMARRSAEARKRKID